jgi:hypothetical protein
LVEDMAFVAKKLGITVDELRDLIAQPPRYYNEFPTNGTQVKLGLKALGLISYVLAIGRKLAPKSS